MIKVLLIEDSAADARLVQLDLENEQDPEFVITHVTRLENALKLIREDKFDIVLSDLNLPDSKGFDTFAGLNRKAPELPIILLTGFNDESLAMNIVKEGAEDYIVKGEVKGRYLVRAIQYAIERRALRKKLQEQNEQLEERLRVDPLTGLFSRRYILSCVDDEVARHNRYGSPISVIHLDVDDFKHINDDYGHKIGDLALKNVADYILQNIREVDKAARYGGDEFLILLPDSDLQAAEIVCEKLTSRKIESVVSQDVTISISLSIGAASVEGEVTSTKLIDTADSAMLAAKKSGKGRYFSAAELIDRELGEDGVDQLKESRNTLREVICQLLGASLSEMERQQDISDSMTEIMQQISDNLSESLKISKEQQRTLYNVIQIIHFQDLGIASEMLAEPESLSPMQKKVLWERFSYNISLLRKIRFLHEETEILANIHEYYDGSGFPHKKKGEAIPYLSRIVSVMYHYALSIKKAGGINEQRGSEALAALRSDKGRQFDPALTEKIIVEIEKINKEYQVIFTGDVLIVEDDVINSKLLEKYMSKAGFNVTTAFSLKESREKLKEKTWKAVFLDIMLPDGDGRSLLSEIQEMPYKPIIIIASSCFDDETMQSVKARGADIFIIKPVKLQLLFRLLSSYHFNPGLHEGMQVISGLTSITDLR